MATSGKNEKFLFWASFFTLIAAGMGFSISGDIMADWGKQFGFTQTELGLIGGMSLAGFGLTIIVFSFFADTLGYGKLMIVAFTLHVIAVATILAAPIAFKEYGKEGAYWCLYIGLLTFSLANGTCEAVINPLTATLFPKNKTHWLNILHAGWPGGLVLGALVGLALNQMGDIGWQIRWGIIFAPILLYGMMMIGRPFPKSEAKVSGVKLRDMMAVVGFLGTAVATALLGLWLSDIAVGRDLPGWVGWAAAVAIWIGYGAVEGFSPGHILLTCLYILHALIGYVELGTDRWIQDITKTVLGNKDTALLAFMWTNILMFTLRFFAGPIVEKISPLGLLFVSAVLGTGGLLLLGLPSVNTTILWLLAVTVYGIGKTFYWPTMLGVISERYPKGGALALGFSGGIGMLAAGLLGSPLIGYKQDYAATKQIEKDAPSTYERYKTPEAKAPLPELPKIAGLDNSKLGILADDGKQITADMELLEKSGKKFSKEETEKRVKEATDAKRSLTGDETTNALYYWWEDTAKSKAAEDKKPVGDATLHGGKQALTWTAAVPAAMAVGFLLLILYFRTIGGYRQVHIEDAHGQRMVE